MQILHSGELVRARGDRWRVLDTRAFDGCQLVTMAGAGDTNIGVASGHPPLSALDTSAVAAGAARSATS
jgi:hypothetical protein